MRGSLVKKLAQIYLWLNCFRENMINLVEKIDEIVKVVENFKFRYENLPIVAALEMTGIFKTRSDYIANVFVFKQELIELAHSARPSLCRHW